MYIYISIYDWIYTTHQIPATLQELVPSSLTLTWYSGLDQLTNGKIKLLPSADTFSFIFGATSLKSPNPLKTRDAFSQALSYSLGLPHASLAIYPRRSLEVLWCLLLHLQERLPI